MYLDKSKLPMVAMEFMNDIHKEEVDLINEIIELIDKKDFANTVIVLDKFVAHTIEHFEIENQHMEKYNFFAYSCHRGEHDRVLMELRNIVNSFKNTQNFDVIDNYFKVVIIDWMINHISSMDFVTAQFISQFRHNI